ncbi:MAG: hypothetical protein JNJ54_10585 [Myxococcaceae bacterium]|nr:hypothetical protein [Myxococcaceae bacterium]
MHVPNPIRVGGEVDAHCNKCELNLAHTILAMVGTSIKRVQCNTCGSQHMFRGQQPLQKVASFAAPRKPSAPRTPRSQVVTIGFDELLKGKDLTKAKKYSIRETFKVDDVVDHPTFGFGIVSAVRTDKVDITFKAEVKTLAHGKTGTEQKPTFQASKPAGVARPTEAAESPERPAPSADEPAQG